MPTDARIPLQVNQFSLADVLKNVEAIKGAAQERAYRGQTMRRQNEQDQRDTQFRGALADWLMQGGGPAPNGPPMHTPPIATPGDEPGAPPPPMDAGGPDMSRATPAPYYGGQDALGPQPDAQSGGRLSTMLQPPASPPPAAAPVDHDDAFRRMVLADPKSALEARDNQFKHLDDQFDMIGRLAGSAYDQPSYENALQRASSMGLDVSHLPHQYSPELVNQVLNQALSGKERVAAERQNLKLQWDQQDDVADNDRADENLQSLEDYRRGQLGNARRGQDMTDRRVRGSAGYTHSGSGGKGGGGPKSEGALYTDIMDHWREGGTPNARELAFVKSYEARHTPRGRGRGRGRMGGGDGPMSAPDAGPVRVNSVAEARALAPGTLFVGPDGKTRRR